MAGSFATGMVPLGSSSRARSFHRKPVKRCDQLFRGRSRHDAVKVVGKLLRFHKRFAAAVRASHEVATPGVLAVKRLQD